MKIADPIIILTLESQNSPVKLADKLLNRIAPGGWNESLFCHLEKKNISHIFKENTQS